MSDVAIIDYGAGNVRSVQYALDRIGVSSVVTDEASTIKSAARVIFPGVGSAGNAMQQLRGKGLDRVIANLSQPVLGICLGMQLLCSYSEEEQTEGLGVVDVRVREFKDTPKVPHMGWNQVTLADSPLFEGLGSAPDMYFVHSYFVPSISESIGTTDYGQVFCSALEKENYFGCQFHPEKSGKAGETLLQNFMRL